MIVRFYLFLLFYYSVQWIGIVTPFQCCSWCPLSFICITTRSRAHIQYYVQYHIHTLSCIEKTGFLTVTNAFTTTTTDRKHSHTHARTHAHTVFIPNGGCSCSGSPSCCWDSRGFDGDAPVRFFPRAQSLHMA